MKWAGEPRNCSSNASKPVRTFRLDKKYSSRIWSYAIPAPLRSMPDVKSSQCQSLSPHKVCEIHCGAMLCLKPLRRGLNPQLENLVGGAVDRLPTCASIAPLEPKPNLCSAYSGQ